MVVLGRSALVQAVLPDCVAAEGPPNPSEALGTWLAILDREAGQRPDWRAGPVHRVDHP